MSIRQEYSRVGPVLLRKLNTEILAICPVDGISFDSATAVVEVDFPEQPSGALSTQVAAAITAHDSTDYEALQTATDFNDFKSTLAASLATLDTDETAIAADITALAAAGTLAAVKPIVNNMLTRQAHTITGFRRVVFVLRHLINV